LKSIQIEPEAALDSKRAAGWYESQRLGLGTEFILELDAAFERAAGDPEAYEKIYKTARRTLLRRFPYAVYFTYSSSVVRVLAVLHQSAGPDAWKTRIR